MDKSPFAACMEREFAVKFAGDSLFDIRMRKRQSRQAAFFGFERNYYNSLIMGRICPGPERARHIARALRGPGTSAKTLEREILGIAEEATRSRLLQKRNPGAEESPEFLTPEEFAAMLRVTVENLDEAAVKGQIPQPIIIGPHRRFHKQTVLEWLKRQTAAVCAPGREKIRKTKR
jgi:excisionase family DNA binding protein